VLVFHQRIDPDSRTPSRGAVWIAETIVTGVTYSTRPRSGAPFRLARVLIAAGVPDQPVQVYTDGIKGFITYRALAKMAELTIGESAAKFVRAEKWREFDAVAMQERAKGISGSSQPADEEARKTPIPQRAEAKASA
jgi:hypothetical protein